MCGVSVSENRKMHVSHVECVRVGGPGTVIAVFVSNRWLLKYLISKPNILPKIKAKLPQNYDLLTSPPWTPWTPA